MFHLKHVIIHFKKHVIISSLAFPIVVLKRGHNSQGCGIIATSAWLANNNLAAGGRTNIRGVAGSQLLTYLNWVPWACFHAKSVLCFDSRLEILEIVHHLQILEVARWHTKQEFVRVWYLQILFSNTPPLMCCEENVQMTSDQLRPIHFLEVHPRTWKWLGPPPVYKS